MSDVSVQRDVFDMLFLFSQVNSKDTFHKCVLIFGPQKAGPKYARVHKVHRPGGHTRSKVDVLTKEWPKTKWLILFMSTCKRTSAVNQLSSTCNTCGFAENLALSSHYQGRNYL